MESLDSTVGIVALAAAGVAVISLLICLMLAMRLRRVRNEQKLVLGDSKTDLVEHAAAITRQVDALTVELEDESERLNSRLADAERRLHGTVSRTAVLRYDAFREGSGRQSSTVALLDDSGTGVLISAILQREQARVYAKPVLDGSSSMELSPEELEAMRQARSGEGPGDAGG